ncbi:MAG: nicotinate (nicotinamide) nucleotide adenylyltransferase [Clostridiales bacterium]|nr:nicotinate (nicotinamide) nucleotide adenylyltransferase [Clostridiales bacterium]
MKTAVFGGTFNPPHESHVEMAAFAVEQLGFDRVVVVPAADPPHKAVEGDATPQDRLRMAELAFEDFDEVEVSDIELRRPGKSYTYDTLRQLQEESPYEYYHLLMGQDMLEAIEQWYRFEELLSAAPIIVFPRAGSEGDLAALVERLSADYGADVEVAQTELAGVASRRLREELRESLPEAVPAPVLRYILERGLYGVRLDGGRAKTGRERQLIEQLRRRMQPHRLPHAFAVMEEMERLALHYGEDVSRARLAGLLHDVTKGESLENQLRLCANYDIVISTLEKASPKLLHALTGAAVARELLGGGEEEIVTAIRYHTTGRSGMSRLEQLLYLADYIEPLREFEGVEPVRALAYEDLVGALRLALDNTLREVLEAGRLLHPDTLEARNEFVAIMMERDR